jgi:hypothetical protein
MLIGYKNEFQWAIFDPLTQKFTHGDLGSSPESDITNGGYGYEHSPFLHETDMNVLHHCMLYCQWWERVQRDRASKMGNVVQLGEDSSGAIVAPRTAVSARRTRIHQLISEVDTNVLNGYFDCTVEVSFIDRFECFPTKAYSLGVAWLSTRK